MKRPVSTVSKALGLATRADLLCWQQFLARVDYKPGWNLTAEDEDFRVFGRVVMLVKMLVHDTFEQRDLKPIVVTSKFEVPVYMHPSVEPREEWELDARLWLRSKIHQIEMHEADEWLRVDGIQHFNPHGDPQDLGRRPEGWEWFGPPEIAIASTLGSKQ